ncbi:hypothetical protein SLEP1_g21904 [Rubroshorea leprosula]|uniref:MATH domain-containing protein n=1 Tax=Rubroshorea leprosula TaxID=152421 RepID=A0AAV5JIA9_9ROSI|nr:hypothetical protein SLEP1_g21904 [Rubroshorea leprosula]
MQVKATEESSMALVNLDSSDSTSSLCNDTLEFTASVRDKPPAHYLLRVESFSLLSQVLQKTRERRYESLSFKAGGYKWKLVLCPGDKGNDGCGYISLYLMIVETDTLPLGWIIDANFKLFVYDQIRDKYYTFEDACVFGAEVYVENENYSGNGECLSMLKTEHEGITWKIDDFSVLKEGVIDSRTFIAGGRKWSLSFHPKGDSRADESLSLFLKLNDATFIPPEQKVCGQYTILVKDQVNGKHCSKMGED